LREWYAYAYVGIGGAMSSNFTGSGRFALLLAGTRKVWIVNVLAWGQITVVDSQ